MKHLFQLLICFAVFLFISCNKSKSYYANTDHTVGMLNVRNWHGYAYGYNRADTLWDTAHVAWPKYHYETVNTSFAIKKINNYVVEVDGIKLAFKSIDSASKQLVYDSTYANSARSYLVFDFGKDSMYYEYHQIFGWNDTAHKYYEINKYLISSN